MSTKEPINSSTCGECATGWWGNIRCKLALVVCKLQNLTEPLCERDLSRVDLDLSVIGYELSVWASGQLAELEVYSEGLALHTRPFRDDVALAAWIDLFESTTGRVVPDQYKDIAKGRLTIVNRIGLFPAFGTRCSCCLGFRIYAALFFGFLLGAVLF